PGMQDLVKPGVTFHAILGQAANNGLIRNVKSSDDPWVLKRLAQHRNPTRPHVQQRGDGSWIRVNERKTEDAGIVAVYSDITDDRRREEQLQAAKDDAERTLAELRQAQESLVHAEKMASLGQLTAGIAHEIKNPLNFVNNFAEVSAELLEELKEDITTPLASLDDDTRDDVLDLFETLTGNLSKIKEHGTRADGIVKGMLSHARAGPSTAQSTELNGLIEETLNLAYHGMRAEDQGFNVTLERNLDPGIGNIEVFPQEITRVLLNLIGNGFYAVNQRRTECCESDYQPTLKVSTRDLGEKVEVRVRDNGTGIPASVIDEVFNPFFTTKPTGEGTGLGLSLSHETIAQQHHGRLQVESREGEFTEFIITLPRQLNRASTSTAS
ncbi:MAG: ATP-binding protein, partial [Gammaproteobacteria bacterium]|nr:ATP-binding protein [Gammaproteobacteria bacterium]